MTALSVVIPAYNEENGIAEIAARVVARRLSSSPMRTRSREPVYQIAPSLTL